MILVLLAEGFEEIEALTSVDYLRRVKKDVTILGINSKTIKGAHNITVVADEEISADATLESCAELLKDLEMIILPGGMPGTTNLKNSAFVCKLVDYCIQQNIYVSAICAAPTILGSLGYLKDKTCTCFPGCEGGLGADTTCTFQAFEQDGLITTGKSAGCAAEFALAIVKTLCGEASADTLRKNLYFPQ